MNKQEAINELMSKCREIIFGDDENVYLSRKRTIELVSQINEPQKVVIPKFVAEWLKKYRYAHTLLKVLNSAEDERIIPSAVNDWILDNQYDFIKAWMDGYEIEQEKLYTVEIADAILTKITRGCERNVKYRMLPYKEIHNVFNDGIYTNFLTETEIKQADERLWQFAKPLGDEYRRGSD